MTVSISLSSIFRKNMQVLPLRNPSRSLFFCKSHSGFSDRHWGCHLKLTAAWACLERRQGGDDGLYGRRAWITNKKGKRSRKVEASTLMWKHVAWYSSMNPCDAYICAHKQRWKIQTSMETHTFMSHSEFNLTICILSLFNCRQLLCKQLSEITE